MKLLTSNFGVTIAPVSSVSIIFGSSSAEGLHFSALVHSFILSTAVISDGCLPGSEKTHHIENSTK